MTSENTLTSDSAIDPSVIGLIGTYVIDLTATTQSNVPVPDELRPMVA